jgi:type I restriction enzyme S subunit
MHVGTLIPHFKKGDFGNLYLQIPNDYSLQERIGEIYFQLSEKVALNRATNQTLETIAQNLFKSWFVDFDPVSTKARGEKPVGMDEATAALFPDRFEDSELGEIPRGWEVKSLDKMADYLNGLALQKFPAVPGRPSLPVIKIAELKQGNSKGADSASSEIPPEYVIRDGDVIFSWSGSLFVDTWCGGAGALNQHLFKVSSKIYPKWFYLLWTKHHLEGFQRIAADKAVTMGHIKRGHLSEAKCCVPLLEDVARFSRHFASLLDEQILLRLESNELEQIRDSLLPKLLSGDISVGEAAEEVSLA